MASYSKVSNKTQDKDVKYLNKDFNSFKSQLIEFTQTYYPNTFNDFSEGSPGMMFLEMAAYVGDVLSFYTDTQLKQGNTSQFSIDLKHFLGLELPLPDMKSQQRANVGASHPFPETINICDAQFDNIRNELLQYGKESSRWISEKFIESKDVTVSDKTFFIETLRTWGDDPCASDDK